MSLSDAKEQIKSYAVSDIIGHYLPLTQRGSNHYAHCPWHDDSKPSLTVNDTKGLFRCFVCDIGGDSISFVQKYKNIDFKESVLDICEKIGIDTTDLKTEKKIDPKLLMASKVATSAAKLYFKHAGTGNYNPFQEFIKNRGLNNETVQNFQIGYAPKGNILVNYLLSIKEEKERNLAIDSALEIGIIRNDKSGNGYYDTFRERIIFPIWDQFSKVVGFSSRAVFPHQKAKYINSQESRLFHKKNVAYGLNFAKQSIRQVDQVLVVEGQMDCIALHQYGLTQSIAISGVALGDRTLNYLKTLTNNFILALDSDAAGMKAMTRINAQLFSEGIIPKTISFNPHKDPDEFLVKEGLLALKERIEKAPDFIDVLVKEVLPEKIPTATDAKLNILQEIFSHLSPLGEHLFASEKAIEVARMLNLQSGASEITETYKTFLNNKKRPNYQSQSKTVPEQPVQEANSPFPLENNENSEENMAQALLPIKLSSEEKQFLQIVIQYPELATSQQVQEILDFTHHPEVKKVFNDLKKLYYEVDESEILNLLRDQMSSEVFPLELKEALSGILYSLPDKPNQLLHKEKLIGDLALKMKLSKLKKRRDQLKFEQRQQNNQDIAKDLITQIVILEKEINNLKKERKTF